MGVFQSGVFQPDVFQDAVGNYSAFGDLVASPVIVDGMASTPYAGSGELIAANSGIDGMAWIVNEKQVRAAWLLVA